MPSEPGKPVAGRRARTLDWINDILDNVTLIQDLVRRETLESFVANKERIYAVKFALIVISEAARRLPKDIHARHADIPWRQVKDLRNAFTHEYHTINLARLWRTASENLDVLKRAMVDERRRYRRSG